MENFEISADYHTHTLYSHGSGTVMENVAEASKKGLKEIAITDHGLKHIVFGMRKRKMAPLKQDIANAMVIYPSVNVLAGIEANINGVNGVIDVRESERSWFDIILAGYHKMVYADKLSDYGKIHLNSIYEKLIGQPTAKMKTVNTDAVVKAIANNPIAILTHINYGLKVDETEVAKACAYYGTYLELNGKRINLTREEFDNILSTDVKLIMSSDAHEPTRVGDFWLPISFVKGLGIEDRIVNYNNVPAFRSPKEK